MEGSLSMGGGSAGSQGHTMGMDNRNMMTPGGKSTISNVVNESGEVTDYICRISWVPLWVPIESTALCMGVTSRYRYFR